MEGKQDLKMWAEEAAPNQHKKRSCSAYLRRGHPLFEFLRCSFHLAKYSVPLEPTSRPVFDLYWETDTGSIATIARIEAITANTRPTPTTCFTLKYNIRGVFLMHHDGARLRWTNRTEESQPTPEFIHAFAHCDIRG
jgi:hypothetical protein